MKTTIKQYLFLILSVALMAVTVNTVIIPYSIISGGVSGLSAIVAHISTIPPALFVFIVNSILIVIAFFAISKSYALNSILGGSVLSPLFIALIPVGPISSDILLSSIFGGLLIGISLYFLSMSNGSTGGTSITGKIVQQATGLPYGISVSLCDIVIVLIGLFVFGIENTMYAIIFIIITSLTANFFEQGAQKTSVFHIITDQDSEMKQAIINDVYRGVTVVKATGGFDGTDRVMLICVAKTAILCYLNQ
ncbi:YitT family protein [Mollicutes bacterium LVI A0039]|nr:YitT family protein [Mollicutes bacterium LVI A0039]